jgi:hypothetical protein
MPVRPAPAGGTFNRMIVMHCRSLGSNHGVSFVADVLRVNVDTPPMQSALHARITWVSA